MTKVIVRNGNVDSALRTFKQKTVKEGLLKEVRKKESYIKKVNVKRITIHEFRHSHVTILRSMNYTIKQVATRIRDTEITVIETYSHLFESDKFVISEGLNKLKL